MKKAKFLSILLLIMANTLLAQSINIMTLTCNSQSDPIAIDSEQPLLTWIVKADGFNREQTAYKVLVASKRGLLNENDAVPFLSRRLLMLTNCLPNVSAIIYETPKGLLA